MVADNAIARIFTAPAPLRAYHGTTDLSPLASGIPPASMCHWFMRTSWERHDRWMGGGPHLEEGIPYANIVWEALGLRDRRARAEGVAPWARRIRTHAELGAECGMLFVTDRRQNAERYGECVEIDLASPLVLDVVDDPHVRTHRGWIVLIKAGARVPLTARRDASPG